MTAATTIVRQPALASSPQPTPMARALITWDPDAQAAGRYASPATETDNTDDDGAEHRVAIRPKKSLPREVPHFFHQRNRKGAPTSTTSETATGSRVAGSQHWPVARSLLQTMAPWGSPGATLKKSGTNLAFSRVSIELN